MRSSRIKSNNGGMFVNKKHTSSDNLSCGHLFNSGVVHVPRTCFRICLSLIALVLIVVLLRMGAFLGPMAQLIIVEAWLIAPRSYGASLSSILGKAMLNTLRNTF